MLRLCFKDREAFNLILAAIPKDNLGFRDLVNRIQMIDDAIAAAPSATPWLLT